MPNGHDCIASEQGVNGGVGKDRVDYGCVEFGRESAQREAANRPARTPPDASRTPPDAGHPVREAAPTDRRPHGDAATHRPAASRTAPDRTGWYIIQVQSAAEQATCRKIERVCAEHDAAAPAGERVGLKECFSPRYKSQKKWKHEWRDVERPLLPGYVIAVVENPALLARGTSGLGTLCKLLTNGEAYSPLDEGERMWIESQTRKGDRVVPMSFAQKEGDVLVVTEGPLKGREGQIVKADRANSIAHIELHVGQITIKTEVGLGILPSRNNGVNGIT